MMNTDTSSGPPFAPAWGFAVPLIAFALSLPTLLSSLIFGTLAIYHAVASSEHTSSAETVLQVSPAFVLVLLYIVFGPMLGCVLCVTQRTRAEQVYGSVHLLGFRMKRMNTIALYCCGLALALFAALIFTNVILAIVSAG